MDSAPTQAFRQARDLLLAQRGRHDAAVAAFRWPQLQHFNWALDWFDVLARDNETTALWVVNEDGREQRLSFAQMAERSNRVAHWLRGRGVKRGDRMLLMLGNVVPLWEVTLAAIKLGAVVSPATTLLSAADLADRVQRGQMRHVVADAVGAARFAEVPGDYTRTIVGASLPGWTDYALADAAPADVRARRPDPCRRPAVAVLHQRHDGAAEDGAAHASELPGGPPDDDVLAGPAPGRRAPEHQLAGLGQACVEQLLRTVECRRDHLRAQPGALRRQVHARHAGALRRHVAVRAADRVARADPGRPGQVAGEAERSHRCRRAAEPRGHRARAVRPGG